MSFAHSRSPECRVPSIKAHGGYRSTSSRCLPISPPHRGQNMPARGHRPGELKFREVPSPARAQQSRLHRAEQAMCRPFRARADHGSLPTRAMPWPVLLCPVGATLLRRRVPVFCLQQNTASRRKTTRPQRGSQPTAPRTAHCVFGRNRKHRHPARVGLMEFAHARLSECFR
jgi:hypothetical protein